MHSLAPQQPTPQPLVPQPLATQQLQINDMVRILTERPRQIPNLYWQPGQFIGVPVSHFRQIKYLPIPNAVPDLDQALSGARVDCARDLRKQLSSSKEQPKFK